MYELGTSFLHHSNFKHVGQRLTAINIIWRDFEISKAVKTQRAESKQNRGFSAIQHITKAVGTDKQKRRWKL